MDLFWEKFFPWILKFLSFVRLVFHKTFSRNSSSGKEIEDDSKNGTLIEILPNEVLSQIFEHLSLEDLIKCYETSQKWREVAKLRINHYLRNPDSLQIISKHNLENLEVFSTLDEDRSEGILICMPNGKYIFGGSKFSKLRSGPITSKFLDNGSKVWKNGPDFPYQMFRKPRSIHDFVRNINTLEFSAGHRISTNEFIVVMNRHILKYDIESKNWSYFVKLKHSRRHSCSIVFDGKLIISGGFEMPHGNVLLTTEIVDLSSGKTWIGGDNNVPRTRFNMDICILDGKPRVVAHCGNLDEKDDIEIWDEKSESWKIRHTGKAPSNVNTKMVEWLLWGLGLDINVDRLDKILIFQNFHLYNDCITNFVSINAKYFDRRAAEGYLRRCSLNLTDTEFEVATKDICRPYYWDFEFEP